MKPARSFFCLLFALIATAASAAGQTDNGQWVAGEDGSLYWKKPSTATETEKLPWPSPSMESYFDLSYHRGNSRLNLLSAMGRAELQHGLHLSGLGMWMSQPEITPPARDLRDFRGALNLEWWAPEKYEWSRGFGLIAGYLDSTDKDDAFFRPGLQYYTDQLWDGAEICLQAFPASFGQEKAEETRELNAVFWQHLHGGGEWTRFSVHGVASWIYQPSHLLPAVALADKRHAVVEGTVSLGWRIPKSYTYLEIGAAYTNNTPGASRDRRWQYLFGARFMF